MSDNAYYSWEWTPAQAVGKPGRMVISCDGEPIYESTEDYDRFLALLGGYGTLHNSHARLTAENEALRAVRDAAERFEQRLLILACGDERTWDELDGLDAIEIISTLHGEFNAALAACKQGAKE